VNKQQLIDQISVTADVSKVVAGKALDAFIDSITSSLAQGDSVNLVGFGAFTVRHRPERTGRNPQSGKPVAISARNTPTFRAGKALKESVN
jgi:DNA-binding protein HU-beta